MPRRRQLPAAVVLIAAVLTTGTLSSGLAHAQEDPEFLIQQGIQLRKENDNEGAIKVLTKAYNLKRSPRAAAHLGMAEYRMSRWIDAETHLAEALRAQNDPWIERSRTDVRKALEEVRTQLGWLEVVGRPAGAEVEVAGRPAGTLPLAAPIRLVTGEVHVRVTMDGYETDRRTVLIASGETARVVLELARTGGTTIAIPPPPPDLTGPAGQGVPPIEVRTSSADGQTWRRPAAWVSAGVATLLIGSGITAAVIQRQKVNEFDNYMLPNTKERPCSTNAPGNGGTECTSLVTEANFAKKLAIGSFIGGGIAGIVAAVLFVTAPAPTEQLAAATCAPIIGPGNAGATCAFRF
jgi:hypothetical protein